MGMEIAGIYGDQLVKALKLTERMVDALRDSRFSPAPATVKALAKRGLALDTVGNFGTLNADGEHVRIHLMGERDCYPCMAQATEVEPITSGTAESVAILSGMVAAGMSGDDDTHTHELPGDAERAWDAENAAAEGADIDAENARERAAQEAEDLARRVAESDMHDDLLAELFPGDDDPHGTWAECAVQLKMEREGCEWCQLAKLASTEIYCVHHVSVEAWVRASEVFDPWWKVKASASTEHASEAVILAAHDAGVAERARVTTVTPWKTSTGSKHKRHGRTRARQVARTRR